MKNKLNALISVYDKSNLDKIAAYLNTLNCNIISTGGTYKYLSKLNLNNLQKVSDITQSPEILDGRVKTLHPVIHGGILAKRDNQKHMSEIKNIQGILIDIVICNLYPFEETLKNKKSTENEIIEMIDIGGPTMIRAAAKNYHSVLTIVDPNDYKLLSNSNTDPSSVDDLTKIKDRKKLASKAFEHVSNYDDLIYKYLDEEPDSSFSVPKGDMVKKLRYGENPHQKAVVYSSDSLGKGIINGTQVHGKEMSFNNIIDGNTAWQIVNEFSETSCAIIKHANPCGLALDESQANAFKKAFDGDQVSAYGGIVAFNKILEEDTVSQMKGIFFELVIAPGITENALTRLQKRKDLRIINMKNVKYENPKYEIKTFAGGYIIQDTDIIQGSKNKWKTVTKTKPTNTQLKDLEFAWKAIKHVKSNGILLVKNQSIVGLGTGQPNRINSIEIAARVAKEKSIGSTLASDAFFPFSDNVQLAHKIGVKSLIQPGGSIRDDEVIDLANKLKISMIFTGTRHFKH